MFHQYPACEEWKEEGLEPFSELILSWNGSRPENGSFHFYISVKEELKGWSSWLLYASWGSICQTSYSETRLEESIRVYQDAFELLDGKKATGFQVKTVCKADGKPIRALHVYTNGQKKEGRKGVLGESVYLPLQGISQMGLEHPRRKDLCSPSSTTAVVRYLGKNGSLDPVRFAQSVWDSGFDIFGNWVLNIAQASAELGPLWSCWVERLRGFEEIYDRLQQEAPVIISVRSPLAGSAIHYQGGHLIAVSGYDAERNQAICIDPAFPSDAFTEVRYDLADLIQAWDRRGKIAYIFRRQDYPF